VKPKIKEKRNATAYITFFRVIIKHLLDSRIV
jgi:hypothetical protein